jgi:hypothetical protein
MEALTIPNLANACQMAREDPDLKIVSQIDINNLGVEDFAKLSHAGERFEVKVEEITTKGEQFIGTVRSDLTFNHPFEFGDFIKFESKNIFNVFSLPVVETKMANENFKKADKG